MFTFLKKIFHIHKWEVTQSEYLGNGRYHCISTCKTCGKHKYEIIGVHE